MQVIRSIVKSLGSEEGRSEPSPSAPGRRHRVHLTSEQMDELVASYQGGATTKELGATYRLHHTTVSAYLKRRGVALRYKEMTPDQITLARKLYESGLSLAKVADRIGPSHNTIRRELIADGVQMRDTHGNASIQ